MRLLSIALAIVLAGPSAPVFADPQAEAHFIHANELYAQDDFEGASEALRLAYEIEPLPKLLYSRAQVERMRDNWEAAADLYLTYLSTNPPEEGRVHALRHLLFTRAQVARAEGDCRLAIDLYDQFVEEYPDAREIEAAKQGRDACEEAMALAVEPEPQQAPVAEPASSVSSKKPSREPVRPRDDPGVPPWYRSVVGGVLAGVGVAGAATGGTLLGLAYRDHRLAEDEPTHEGSAVRYQRARSKELAGAITLAFSGAALVLSGLAYGLAARRHRRDRVSLSPGGVQLRF